MSLKLPLSLGLGLGLCANLTFLAFLLANEFNWLVIDYLNSLFLVVLALLTIKKRKNFLTNLHPQNIKLSNTYPFIILTSSLFFIIRIAQDHPFGGWDGWALWNLKTRFLILSGQDWLQTFNLQLHTQPDYPLLLPLINVFTYSWGSNNLNWITMTNAITFTLLTGLLLYGSVKKFTSATTAFIAAALILSHPYFIFRGTVQYADITLAYFLLAGLCCMIIVLKTKNRNASILTGMFLGLMTFTKNEGIMMAVLAMATFLFCLISEKKSTKKVNWALPGWMILGLFLTGWSTLIFKLFYSPPNLDVFTGFSDLKFFNIEGIKLTLTYTSSELIQSRWNYIWILIILLIALNLKNIFYRETKALTLFFILYIIVLIYIYLTTINFDLHWRLTRTIPRVYFYLLPSILFFSFYGLSKEK